MTKRVLLRLLLNILTIPAVFPLPIAATASGLSVSPSRLDFEIAGNTASAEKPIVVANPTADVSVFEIFPDEFAGVIIKVEKPKWGQSENLSTHLSVVGKPLAENKVNVLSGAKIPISASFAPARNAAQWPDKFLIFALAGLFILSAGFALGKKTGPEKTAP